MILRKLYGKKQKIMTERTYNQWNEKEEAKLIELYNQGLSNKELEEQLNRNKNSISHRIAILKQQKILIKQRKIKTNGDAYNNTPNNIIENFKARKLKTRHADTKLGKISDDNYKLILNMDQRNQADGLRYYSRSNYIRYLNEIALILKNKSFLNADLEQDIQPHLIKRKKELKDSAYRPIESCLKEFISYLLEKHPEKQNLIEIYNFLNKKRRSRTKAAEPEEKEHLNRTEIVKLIAGIKGKDAEAIRDRALLSVLYDSGARISELLAVTKKNTHTDANVPKLYLPISKTIPRDSNMLKFSLPYLLEWIKVHEFWNDDKAALFYSLGTSNYGEPLKSSRAGQILRRALKIAKINKKITLHSLRHSKAYHCAEEGMMVGEANRLFGWSRTSGMFHYYSTASNKEIEQKELERAGKLTQEETEARKKERNAFVVKNCLKCGEPAKPDQFVCSRCGLALNRQAAQNELQQQKKIEELDIKVNDLVNVAEFKDKVKAMETELKQAREFIKMAKEKLKL